MLGNDRRQLVDVHDVLGALLVRAALDKLELLGGHADGLEDGGDDVAVVLDTQLYQLDGRLQVIEEAVDIGEQDRDMAAGGQVLGDFDGGDKVAAVRAAGGGGAWTLFASVFCSFDRVSASSSSRQRTPVDLGMPTLGQDFLDNLRVEDLGQVLADERELLGCVCGRHDAFLLIQLQNAGRSL